jgi:soluble lytic murein transglycosylase
MLKKILFLGLIISIVVNFNYVSAETGLIIPLKKPSLSDNEIKDKISKNILKPLKKAKKTEILKKRK